MKTAHPSVKTKPFSKPDLRLLLEACRIAESACQEKAVPQSVRSANKLAARFDALRIRLQEILGDE
jgi:hypothetical protein